MSLYSCRIDLIYFAKWIAIYNDTDAFVYMWYAFFDSFFKMRILGAVFMNFVRIYRKSCSRNNIVSSYWQPSISSVNLIISPVIISWYDTLFVIYDGISSTDTFIVLLLILPLRGLSTRISTSSSCNSSIFSCIYLENWVI
jgi:hypothetical protein